MNTQVSYIENTKYNFSAGDEFILNNTETLSVISSVQMPSISGLHFKCFLESYKGHKVLYLTEKELLNMVYGVTEDDLQIYTVHNEDSKNKITEPPEGLTSSELQSLKSLLKVKLNSLHYRLDTVKFDITQDYEEADQSNGEIGEYYFKVLNSAKDYKVQIKREIKTLSNIQRKIKKLC